MLYNRGMNNTPAWKVTWNWQVTTQCSLITLVGYNIWVPPSSMSLCILNSPMQGCSSGGQLTSRVTCPVSVSHCPLHVKGHYSFFERTKIIPATGGSWTLPSNEVAGLKQQQGSKSDSFFRVNTKWGCPQWKERKQGSRKWLLKRCILFNLAIRKLNSLNKRRMFLTYIDVPEFLLQVGVGKGE